MAKITYIVPVHKFDDTVSTLLSNALKSIKETKYKDYAVSIVGPSEVMPEVEALVGKMKMKSATNYLVNEGDTDFFSQVNFAALHCTSKFFCIVEYDDVVLENWPVNALKYQEATDASVVLPLTEYLDNGEMVSFGNELAWADGFAGDNNGDSRKLGFVDLDGLETYMDFNVTGALIKTEDFLYVGSLKPSLKITAWYEFLLRTAYNAMKIFVAPKLGYCHTIGRDGSYMKESAKEITPEEGKWLIETARQEYFFKEDRKKRFGE